VSVEASFEEVPCVSPRIPLRRLPPLPCLDFVLSFSSSGHVRLVCPVWRGGGQKGGEGGGLC
jgi:hypothetical protein